MHFVLDAGHNAAPGDTGAVALKNEDRLTAELTGLVYKLLVNKGHSVTLTTVNRAPSLGYSLQQRVNQANQSGADLFVSLHFNCFKPTDLERGSEVLYTSASGLQAAKKVLPHLVKLGFKDRGCRPEGFYVLVHTDMPAILIESCFIDSKADVALLTKVGMPALAQAIVTGLTA
jgi:N-acetylmuramoyl-L-alanine amidase